MRRAAKIDDNQTGIVQALRNVGAVVYSLAPVGNGIPDLLVAYRSGTYLLECKDGAKTASRKKLTPQQIEFHRTWTGGPLHVVDGIDAALVAIGAFKP